MREADPLRLRGAELLRGLSGVEPRALKQRCRWRRYRAGQQIVERQKKDRGVSCVVQGAAAGGRLFARRAG